MKRIYLARRLGLDGNRLRRRSDKVSIGLVAGVLAAFLMGAPFLAIGAANWAEHIALAELQTQRSWRQVPAVLLQDASPAENIYGGYFTSTWVKARWTAPNRQIRSGEITAMPGLTAGQRVLIWVDAAGTPMGPPMSHHAVSIRRSVTAAFAVVMLGLALAYLAAAGRWLLDRRRLAGWDRQWAVIEPQWTRRFRSRG
jgi:hypothetical protein